MTGKILTKSPFLRLVSILLAVSSWALINLYASISWSILCISIFPVFASGFKFPEKATKALRFSESFNSYIPGLATSPTIATDLDLGGIKITSPSLNLISFEVSPFNKRS